MGEELWINLWSTHFGGEVCGIHNYSGGKAKYDFKVIGEDGEVTRIYNVDSKIVSKYRK